MLEGNPPTHREYGDCVEVRRLLPECCPIEIGFIINYMRIEFFFGVPKRFMESELGMPGSPGLTRRLECTLRDSNALMDLR